MLDADAVRLEVIASELLAGCPEVVVREPLAMQPEVVALDQPTRRLDCVLEPLAMQPEVVALELPTMWLAFEPLAVRPGVAALKQPAVRPDLVRPKWLVEQPELIQATAITTCNSDCVNGRLAQAEGRWLTRCIHTTLSEDRKDRALRAGHAIMASLQDGDSRKAYGTLCAWHKECDPATSKPC